MNPGVKTAKRMKVMTDDEKLAPFAIEAATSGSLAAQVPNTSPAGNNKIPDEWYDNDAGPSVERDKKETDGFTDRLVEKYRRARNAFTKTTSIAAEDLNANK
jgi:hypothetical protein